MAGWHSWQGEACPEFFYGFIKNQLMVVVAVVAVPAEGGYIQKCQLETLTA